MGLFLRKNYLVRCCNWLSLLNWIGTRTLSLLLKLRSRKLEPWFVLWSFFLLRLLCISINLPCGHVWAGTPSCYLELLDRLQKRICRTIGPSLAAFLQPLAYGWNVASLSFFYRYYFGGCSSELAELVPLPYSWGRSLLVIHVCFNPFFVCLFLFLVTPCLVVDVQPCMD